MRFLGHGAPPSPGNLQSTLAPPPLELSWLQQVHSSRVRTARPGLAGSGDVLVTSKANLALAIATADCLGVVLAAPDRIAAAHAGWRGLVAGALPAAVEALASLPRQIRAWIGPSIGPCCYEVGDDVAESLTGASHEGILTPGRGERPHADLRAVALHQLASCGVTQIRWFDLCTRCEGARLESYRRDRDQAGRNWAVVWRPEAAAGRP